MALANGTVELENLSLVGFQAPQEHVLLGAASLQNTN